MSASRAIKLVFLLLASLFASALPGIGQQSEPGATQDAAAHGSTTQQDAHLGLPSVPDVLRRALGAGDTRRALQLVKQLEREQPEQADAWRYVKGLALAQDGQLEQAILVFTNLEQEFSTGKWLRKARFKRADLLRELGRFEEAEMIYEQEARRLLSPERQAELAGIYMQFARAAAEDRRESNPDAAAPDFGKAITLYQKALELGVPAQLRAEALFGIAEAYEGLADWNGAAQALRTYLDAVRDHSEQRDVQALEAAYRLGRARFNAGAVQEARWEFESFIRLIEAARGELEGNADSEALRESWSSWSESERAELDSILGRARYALARTYNWGAPDVEQRVAALHRLVEKQPQHELVPQALFEVASSWSAAGNRTEEARAAYAAFLDRDWVQPAEAEQREELEGLKRRALYLRGQAELQLGDALGAIATFQDYVRRYPTGANWSEAQQATIEAEYQIGARAFQARDWDEARSSWSEFLVAHPLDSRAARIGVTIGQSYRDEARELLKTMPVGEEREAARQALFKQAIEAWERVASKYPGSNEASEALYSIAYLYENTLQDLDSALQAYRRCNFGSHGGNAAARMMQMTERELRIETPRIWRSHETVGVDVQLRNVEELTARVYALDLQAYFRKHLTHQQIEDLDLDLIAPDLTVPISVEGYQDYLPIRQRIELPMEGVGVWAVAIDDGERRATTLVVRSDIDVVIKSSRREFFAYAQDMVRGVPAKGVDVLVALPDNGGGAPHLRKLKTGRDGVARLEFDELAAHEDLRVLASRDGHFASTGMTLSQLPISGSLQARGLVYTDRTAYRPGQRVNWRAVIREVADGDFAAQPGASYVAQVRNPAGAVVRSEKLVVSDFGTLHGDYILPRAAQYGAWSIRLWRPNGPTFQGSFQVAEFRLQQMRLDTEFERVVYYRGETVRGTVRASYYYGEALANRPLLLRFPDGRELSVHTDAQGEYEFEFETQDYTNSQALAVQAQLPEEGVESSELVYLANYGYQATVTVSRPVVLAGSSFSFEFRTADAAGEAVARTLQARLLRSENTLDGWVDHEVETFEVQTDDEGRASHSMSIAQGGIYRLRLLGEDRFGLPVTAEQSFLVSGEEDETRLRILSESNTLPVGVEHPIQIVNRTESGLALLTFEGERVLQYRLIDLVHGVNSLDIEMEAALAPNFRLSVALMDGNQFHEASVDFRLERELHVSIQARAEEVAPGEEATVDVMITDQNGKPVQAEFSLAVVDESIFARFADGLPELGGYFLQERMRPLAFRTESSCGFTYVGETRMISAAILEEEERELAAAQWAEDRSVLRERLREQRAYKGPGDAAPAAPTLGAVFADSGLVAFDADAAALGFDLDEIVGVGGGAGGRYGGRGGRGGGKRGGSPSPDRSELPGLNPSEQGVPGEMAAWINEGLAFWTPNTVTNKDGAAVLSFTMPERSTEWRLTARAVGQGQLFGEALGYLLSRAPFAIELITPVSLTEGDQPRLMVRLHNLKDVAVDAQLRVRVLNEGFEQTFPADLSLASGQERELSFLWEGGVPLTDELQLEAEVVVGAGAEAESYRTESTIAVQAWGRELVDFASGVLTADAAFELQLENAEKLRDLRFEINFGSSLRSMVVDSALDRRGLYEWSGPAISPSHGVTASRLLGVVAARKLLESGASDPGEDQLLRQRAESLIGALVSTQKNDGSWARMKSGDVHWQVSARVMHALAVARSTGLTVPRTTMDNGASVLKVALAQTAQRDTELRAMILLALSHLDAADFAVANRLHRERSQLSPAALSYSILALAKMDRMGMAAEMAQVLESNMPATAGVSVAKNAVWNRDPLDAMALASLALQTVSAASTAAERSVDWLLAHRPWNSARGRGLATAAVGAWALQHGSVQGDSTVSLTINGNTMQIELQAGQFVGLSDALEGLQGPLKVSMTLQGKGQPYYQAMLRGFSTELSRTRRGQFHVYQQHYSAMPPRYQGKEIRTGYSTLASYPEPWRNVVTELPRGERTRFDLQYTQSTRSGNNPQLASPLTLTVPLPAGAQVVEGSVRGRFEHFQRTASGLVFYLASRGGSGTVQFDLVGLVPGEYRVLPSKLEDSHDPSRVAWSDPSTLKVLERGQLSQDAYRATPDELFYLGLAKAEAGEKQQGYELLRALDQEFGDQLSDSSLRQLAGKLLFLAIEFGEASEVVRYFEILKEKNPELNIPFADVLSIGAAYRELEEFERALLVYRATIEESFGKDLKVAGALDEQGQTVGSLAVIERLWLEFPDLPFVVDSYLALAERLLQLAPTAHQNESLAASGFGRAELTLAGISALQRFLSLYSEEAWAPDAALNLVSAYLLLEDYETTLALAAEMREQFTQPQYADAFRYTEAVAQWYLGEEAKAVKTLQWIIDATYTRADGTVYRSENRDLALYILAQIHHARQDFDGAAAYYARVENTFSDARQVLTSFRKKSIAVDEVTEARPGQTAQLELRYRNIEEAEILVYQVDLMTLYLRERNLSQITSVNLAGIAPTQSQSIKLRSSTGMREASKEVALNLKKPGAYLVIIRGDELHASGLVLVSDLDLQVEEYPGEESLRVQVTSHKTKKYLREVDVRVVGSMSSGFQSGKTDPRGVYLSNGVRGAKTVIARLDGDQYAFYRGEALPEEVEGLRAGLELQFEVQDKASYFDNVLLLNSQQVQLRQERFSKEVQRDRKGVSVGRTTKQK